MNSESKMIAPVIRLVEASRRHARTLSLSILACVAVVGLLAARHIAIDTDTDKLFSADLPWRRAGAELDRAFPQNSGLLAVVIDAATPDQAEDAAAILADRLAADHALFRDVREPDGGPFFQKNGLLFLARADVQKFADQMIEAQPMIGTLASDPSARGVFDALTAQVPEMRVGWNEPYAAKDGVTFTLEQHGDARGLAATMIEIRNTEILEPAGVGAWAERLARCLEIARVERPGT